MLSSGPVKVLLLENIHPLAADLLRKGGHEVVLLNTSLDEKGLIEQLKGVQILGIRSKTNITKKVLENCPDLLAIGAFCIGVNQIDVNFSNARGVPVFNAPYSNTR